MDMDMDMDMDMENKYAEFKCKVINRRYEKAPIKSGLSLIGRRERIRTSDPLVPNQLRYQAALLAV